VSLPLTVAIVLAEWSFAAFLWALMLESWTGGWIVSGCLIAAFALVIGGLS
jgi:hypothetical protein